MQPPQRVRTRQFLGHDLQWNRNNLDGQTDALTAAGCEKVFSDTASGKLAERPELALCLGYLRAGDTLVVWRLDRLGRSLRHLVETVNALAGHGVAFASLHEGIDTTTSTGRLIFHIFAALAEFERELIAERAAVGRQAARARIYAYLEEINAQGGAIYVRESADAELERLKMF